MKRKYVKPKTEALDTEMSVFLAASRPPGTGWYWDEETGQWKINTNPENPEDGDGARGFGDFYDDEY